jgi:hypothetical protein
MNLSDITGSLPGGPSAIRRVASLLAEVPELKLSSIPASYPLVFS